MMSVLVGTNAFAASSLVSGANQNKNTALQSARSGSLKMTSGAKGVVGGSVNTGVARMGKMPAQSISKSKASTLIGSGNSGVSNTTTTNAGGDGDVMKLSWYDNEIWGQFFNKMGKPTSLVQKLTDFGEWIFGNTPENTTLDFRCNVESGLFEYAYDDSGDWHEMTGSRCTVDSAVPGVDGVDGQTPRFRCNDKGVFEYTFAPETTQSPEWVEMTGSRCVAGKGRDGVVPTFKCAGLGVILYTYSVDSEVLENDKISYWYHPGWEVLENARCNFGDKGAEYYGAYAHCDDGLLTFNDGLTGKDIYTNIACNFDIYYTMHPDEYANVGVGSDPLGRKYGCSNNKLVIYWNSQKYETEFPCGNEYCVNKGEAKFLYCDRTNHVVETNCGNNVWTNVSCGIFPEYYCNWRNNKFYMNGNTNTGIDCDNVQLSCTYDKEGKGHLYMNGSEITTTDCKDFAGAIKCNEKNIISYKDMDTGVSCPADRFKTCRQIKETGDYECYNYLGDFIENTYGSEEKCNAACK